MRLNNRILRLFRTIGLATAIVFLCFALILSGCQPISSVHTAAPISLPDEETSSPSDFGAPAETSDPSLDQTQEGPETVIPSYTTEAALLAVGDIMMHMPQLPASYDAKTKTYNFNNFFTHVKPILEEGDWVLANLEAPLGGEDLGYSGYPMFNAPPELAAALKYAGFTIVTTANNHAMDRKEIGVIRTLERLNEQGLVTKGTAASAEEAEQWTIVTKNDIKMGILAYTYGTNGIKVPKDKPYLISLIDKPKMMADIAGLREAGADVVTIALHFGTEYQRKPNKQQMELARECIQAGADIILGAHAHVVQPYEKVEVTNEDGSKRTGYIVYSMGNFLSNMKDEYTDYGIIFSVHIKKHFPEGTVELHDASAIPTWVHISGPRAKRQYRILPVQHTIEHRNNPLLREADYKRLKEKLQALTAHLESMNETVRVQASPPAVD